MKQLGITQVPEPLKIDNLQKLSKLKIKKMISFCNKKIENLGVKGFDQVDRDISASRESMLLVKDVCKNVIAKNSNVVDMFAAPVVSNRLAA